MQELNYLKQIELVYSHFITNDDVNNAIVNLYKKFDRRIIINDIRIHQGRKDKSDFAEIIYSRKLKNSFDPDKRITDDVFD